MCKKNIQWGDDSDNKEMRELVKLSDADDILTLRWYLSPLLQIEIKFFFHNSFTPASFN